MKFKLITAFFGFVTLPAICADVWTPYYSIEKVQSLASWQGGMIRIEPTQTTNPANCTKNDRYDFAFAEGTPESRAAVISALYTAFTTGTDVRLLIDGSKCSVTGVPLVKGTQMKK